jgi:TonB family protein
MFRTHLSLVGAAAVLAAVIGVATTAAASETGLSALQPLYTIEAPTPLCAGSESLARITDAHQPEYPAIALGMGVEGNTLVVFTMNQNGTIADASVADTSGNQWLDQAAVDAVRKSRFAPAVHNCSKIGGVYGVEVLFAREALSPIGLLTPGPGGKARVK